MSCPPANSSLHRPKASTQALNPGCSRHKQASQNNMTDTPEIHWHQNAGLLHMLHTARSLTCLHMSHVCRYVCTRLASVPT